MPEPALTIASLIRDARLQESCSRWLQDERCQLVVLDPARDPLVELERSRDGVDVLLLEQGALAPAVYQALTEQGLVLPAVVGQLKPGGQLLMLVKPQFELQPGQLGKGGIVKDEALYEQVRGRIWGACQDLSLNTLNWLSSAIEGGDGNREFFMHAMRSDEGRDKT